MDVSRMKSKAPRHQPACMVAHTMINKFSVIIGNCDLFLEDTEPDTQPEKRIRVIREVARTAVEELLEHLQQVEAETQHRIRGKSIRHPSTISESGRNVPIPVDSPNINVPHHTCQSEAHKPAKPPSFT